MKGLVAWSGGKDAAWALHLARQQDVEVAALLTTTAAGRVAMHEVRGALVEAQAAAAGLPLWTIPLPWPCPNAEYESAMRASSCVLPGTEASTPSRIDPGGSSASSCGR